MKLILLTITILLSPGFAEECTYDESAYLKFVTEYAASHSDVELYNEFSFRTVVGGMTALVKGGGCHHLGYTVEIENHSATSEADFIEIVLTMVSEFGSWIGYEYYVKTAISEKKWESYEDGTYFFDINNIAVLVGSFNEERIFIEFYLN